MSRVDVILPTHSRPRTLALSISSVLAQTHRDFELHVVGDGAGEDTERVACGSGDPRVRYYSFPKGPGCAYAHRNTVLRRTEAPFIAYITDDDLWFPDHLERALVLLDKDRADLVAFRPAHVSPSTGFDPYFFAFDWRARPLATFLRNWFMGSVECVHRRSVFDRVGYWNADLRRFGDREFYNRVRRNVPARYADMITVLRFYADQWQPRYAPGREPPQQSYLAELSRPDWREAIRRRAADRARSSAVRARQCADFLSFATRYAPRFARLGLELASTRFRSH